MENRKNIGKYRTNFAAIHQGSVCITTTPSAQILLSSDHSYSTFWIKTNIMGNREDLGSYWTDSPEIQ